MEGRAAIALGGPMNMKLCACNEPREHSARPHAVCAGRHNARGPANVCPERQSRFCGHRDSIRAGARCRASGCLSRWDDGRDAPRRTRRLWVGRAGCWATPGRYTPIRWTAGCRRSATRRAARWATTRRCIAGRAARPRRLRKDDDEWSERLCDAGNIQARSGLSHCEGSVTSKPMESTWTVRIPGPRASRRRALARMTIWSG